MTARELYERDPLRVETDVRMLKGTYYDHLPEVQTFTDWSDAISQDRVELRVIAEEWMDPRRFWRVLVVAFNSAEDGWKPVMVCTNGGREGDDHSERYITDIRRLAEMVGYIASCTVDLSDDENVVDEDQDVPAMTHFYDWDAFKRTGFGS